ncbi:Rrp15p-domain-containing protein [Amylostereum chailletii]|nr:Rrp15p-domain-containing protein [Amylostereum chailletii]
MPPTKRRRLSDDTEEATGAGPSSDVEVSDDESISTSGSGSDTPDTENEIADTRRVKSKKTQKRKHRATDSSRFGAALQTLLNTDAPSTLPLSLKPEVSRARNDAKLETKAKKILKGERKDKEDKGHVRDVIGGWGGESERALRKIAQRGVVKLFNAIQQSQASAAAAVEETKAARGSGKPTLPAPSLDKGKGKQKGKSKDNPLGRGKESVLDKDDFMDMIRSGGIVSKS